MSASFTTHPVAARDSLLAGEFPRVARVVTIAAGADLPRGAALGRVTADGKYTLSAAAAGDGSGTVVAVLAEDAAAASADAQATVYLSGEFNLAAMTLGAGHDATTAEGGTIFITANIAA